MSSLPFSCCEILRGLTAKQKADAGRGPPEQTEVGTNTPAHAGPEVFSASRLPSSDYLLLQFPIKAWLMEPGTILDFQPVF